jgi:hemerythrin-like domain-containing protein
MKCTDLLLQDHKLMLRGLDILEAMAAKVKQDELVEPADVEIILRFLRVFGDEHHQAKEESALFPVLMRTASLQQRPLRQMLFEHDQERSLVEGLEDALKSRKGLDFVHYANRLTALLRNHIYKEDHILFDVVDKSLSEKQDEEVVTEFRKFDAPLELCNELHRLEWAYLRKTATA